MRPAANQRGEGAGAAPRLRLKGTAPQTRGGHVGNPPPPVPLGGAPNKGAAVCPPPLSPPQTLPPLRDVREIP